MALWGSKQVQFVWFLSDTTEFKIEAVFVALTGEEPDTVQRNRVPNPANPNLAVADGTVDEVLYRLVLQPGRLDLFVIPPEDQADFPLLNTEQVLKWFLERLGSLEGQMSDVFRVSIVANLVLPMPDEKAAHEKFCEIVGLQFNIPDLRDPLVQMNRRMQLASADFELNRLTRFGIISAQQFILEVSEAGLGAGGTPISKKQFGISMMLDFNTVATGRIIEKSVLKNLFNEIVVELTRVGEAASPLALGN